MLSRRNIRIKVMQVLYAMNRDTDLSKSKALSQYGLSIRQSYDLYLFNLLYLLKVAEHAKTVQKKKLEKLRPTEEDLQFKPILGNNQITRSLLEHIGLRREFQYHKMNEKVEEEKVNLLYKDFSASEEYIAYLKKENHSLEDHRQILLSLYKHLLAHDLFEDTLDENYLFWEDDKSLVVGAIKKTIKALPATNDFFEEYKPTDETVKEFGEELLTKVHEMDEELFNLIEPTLKNWDAERVAVIDMILLKMAVCELVSFPTIPTKVTLNEFVEVSKLYSTDKSKDFINGILDRLLKKMEKDGKVIKEGRGLIQ